MLLCTKCQRKGARDEFQSSDPDLGYVCPGCGMDESGIIAICETCGVTASDLDIVPHYSELCFK